MNLFLFYEMTTFFARTRSHQVKKRKRRQRRRRRKLSASLEPWRFRAWWNSHFGRTHSFSPLKINSWHQFLSFSLFFSKLVAYTFLYWLPNYIHETSGVLKSFHTLDYRHVSDFLQNCPNNLTKLSCLFLTWFARERLFRKIIFTLWAVESCLPRWTESRQPTLPISLTNFFK